MNENHTIFLPNLNSISYNFHTKIGILTIKGIGGKQKDQLLALVSPQIENFILLRVISYHIHAKMAKKYEFHTKNEKSYQPGSRVFDIVMQMCAYTKYIKDIFSRSTTWPPTPINPLNHIYRGFQGVLSESEDMILKLDL